MTRYVLIFVAAAGLGFGLLFALSGSPFPDADMPGRITITPIHTDGKKPEELPTVEMKWKGRPIGLALSPNQVVEHVDVPLIDPETQLEEGRFTFAVGRYDPTARRLRVQNPKVTMWNLDRDRKLVDRSRETTLIAEFGLIDPNFDQADLYRNVVLHSSYRDSDALLQTTHLKCHLQKDRVTTDKALAITYGKDFKVLGEGLDATPKTAEMTILRNVLVRLVQRGGRMNLPFAGRGKRKPEAAGKKDGTPEHTELITTCDGKLYLKRLAQGKQFRVIFHDNVEVLRGKGRIRSQVLDLALETVKKPPRPGKATAPEKKKKKGSDKRIDVKQMTAYDRVHMFHPTQGEAHGDFFRWEKLPSRKQRAVLRGSPRLVLTEKANLEMVKDKQGAGKPKSRPRGRTVITSKGEMVFLRDDPERQTGAPDRAIFKDKVVLRRLVADLKQAEPLEIRSNKLTLFIEMEQGQAAKKPAKQSGDAEQEQKARVRRCVAEGDVRVIDPSFEATGQRCNWHDLGAGDEKLVMIGHPKLLLKDVEDDDYVDLPSAERKQPVRRDPNAKQLRSDVEITSRGEMVMRSYQQRTFTRGIFDEDVVVRRFPRDAAGRRLAEHELTDRRSTMLSDHLEVDLKRAPRGAAGQPGAKSGNSFQMQELRAKGNVQINSSRGQATSRQLVYHKATDQVILTDQVLLFSPDGSRYKGDKLIYLRDSDQLELISTRPKPAEVRQMESLPKGAPKGTKRGEHVLRAPRIFYDRKRNYMRATGGVYGRFLSRPGSEDSFLMLGPKAKRDGQGLAQDDKRTPWVLKARVVEAWTEAPAKGQQPRGNAGPTGAGQLRRIKALGKVHIYSTEEKDPREAQGEFFDHDRRTQITLLKGGGNKRAELWSGANQVSSNVIRFDHTSEVATCPTGGKFSFKEKPEKGQATKKAQEVVVTCDGLTTHDRKKGLATFNKNVKIVRGEAEVRADWARAELDTKTRRVNRAVATGKEVQIISANDHAKGTRLVWDYQSKLATLTGSPQAVLYQKDNIIKADRVTFNQETQEASYSGRTQIIPRNR